MELHFSREAIEFTRDLDNLDTFVIDFTSVLDEQKIEYVLMAGYVAILFGRNRTSEDVDIFIEKINAEKFKQLWEALSEKFECLITASADEAFSEYLETSHAIRFSYKGKFIPNMEIKFPKVELDTWSLQHKQKVILNGKVLFISPIELQIAYKIFLGSEKGDKDLEDAKFLYDLFKDHLDHPLFLEFMRKLNIEEMFKKYIQ